MVDKVKATYALAPSAVEDLDTLGLGHRWSRSKTIEGLIGFYARLQHEVQQARFVKNRLREQMAQAEENEEENLKFEELCTKADLLDQLMESIERGLSPSPPYEALNAGRELLEDSARAREERGEEV